MATKVVNAVMRATKRAANREKFAYVRVPRDPAERVALFSEHSKALTSPGQLYSQGPAGMAARKALRWRGQGGYWGDLARSAWDSSAGLRAQAGEWARSGAGGSLGLAAGHLSKYLGTGDYTVDNALVGAGLSSAGIPTFGPEMQNYRVCKTEFLRNIYAPQLGPGGISGQFQNIILPLNPGLNQTFPWLSLVAPQFEEYEFMQLMFYWRPMVSDFNSGTGQVGEIVMTTQYNPSEPPFVDVSRAKNYMGAMSCKTSQSMNQGVECDPTKNSGAPGKYVRTGPLFGTNQDLKQYDLGNLNVMTSGTPPQYAGQILGELWVAYTVELRKPKLPDSSGAEILRDYFQSSAATNSGIALATLITQPTLYGAQNRFGGSIELTISGGTAPADSQWNLTYTFPSWYTGNAKLTATAFGVKNLTGIGGLRPFSGTFTNFAGEVTGTDDLANTVLTSWPAPDVDTYQPGFPFTIDSGSIPGNYSTTVNCIVAENTSGGANKVNIPLLVWATVNGPPLVSGWSFDVSEYNAGFNSPTTGQILLVDQENNAVAQPWA